MRCEVRQRVLSAVTTALAATLVTACHAEDDDRGPSVLIVTLDTTNAGALSCYGGRAGLTPNLDRLAREGILFENARTVAPLTLPAHCSVMTGLYPPRHGVRRNGGEVLAPEARTLAEVAREAGHDTAAFIAAPVLNAEFGLSQGFDVYDDPEAPATPEAHLTASRRADEMVDRALEWLTADATRPFFLWVHLFDAHYPYDAPAVAPAAGGDAYLAEVAYADRELGRLLDHLRDTGRLDETLVVVVGDHGEGLGRHGEATHAAFVYDSTLRVPLLVRMPSGSSAPPPGTRVATPTSVADVFATVRPLLAGPAPDAAGDGVDLLAPEPQRGVYFESYFGVDVFGWSQLAGWADAEGKYVFSSEPEFFDLVADPDEEVSAIEEHAESLARYRDAIGRLSGLPRLEPVHLDESYRGLLGQIERLGYAGADLEPTVAPAPLEPLERPSPHRRVRAYADYTEARELTESGGFEEAVRLLRQVVQGNPANVKAQFYLGQNLKSLERWAEAVPAFEAVVGQPGGTRIPAQLNLAVCHANLGRNEEALRYAEAALAETIGPPGALELLIELYERLGRPADAARERARLSAAGR